MTRLLQLPFSLVTVKLKTYLFSLTGNKSNMRNPTKCDGALRLHREEHQQPRLVPGAAPVAAQASPTGRRPGAQQPHGATAGADHRTERALRGVPAFRYG